MEEIAYRKPTQDQILNAISRFNDGADMKDICSELRISNIQFLGYRKSLGHLASKKTMKAVANAETPETQAQHTLEPAQQALETEQPTLELQRQQEPLGIIRRGETRIKKQLGPPVEAVETEPHKEIKMATKTKKKSPPRKFTLEEKMRAVEEYLTGTKVATISKTYDVIPQQVYNWVTKFKPEIQKKLSSANGKTKAEETKSKPSQTKPTKKPSSKLSPESGMEMDVHALPGLSFGQSKPRGAGAQLDEMNQLKILVANQMLEIMRLKGAL